MSDEPASEKQIEFGKKLGLDLSKATKQQARAQIQEKLNERDAQQKAGSVPSSQPSAGKGIPRDLAILRMNLLDRATQIRLAYKHEKEIYHTSVLSEIQEIEQQLEKWFLGTGE